MRALAFLLLLPAAAAAQDVAVRGGDHDTFARLVFSIPAGADWSLGSAPGGVALTLPGQSFDLARAFDRIPRTRIAGLSAEGDGRLVLSVACDCHATAFLFRPDRLVVDVADGPAPEGAVAPGAAGPVPAPAPDPAALADGEAAILEGLARAASQGLLDVAPGPADLPEMAEAPDEPDGRPVPAEGPAALPPEPPAALLPATPARPGLAFRGAADRAPAGPPVAADGTACIPDDRLDMAAWAGTGDWGAEVAPRVLALVDARDRPDPDAAEALARAYLAFGFGREAATALRLDGAASAGRDLLLVLAALVDGDPVDPGAFDDQGGCLGAVALWRALARGTLEGTDERERTAVAVALRALPDPLRGHLALRAATLFLDAGDAAGARAAADMARGADTGGGIEAALTDAAIARAAEGPGAGLDALLALARTDPRMTPAATVELIGLAVAEGRPVPEDVLALARSMRFEAEGGPVARDLLVAEMAALAAAGRWEEAVALAAEGDGGPVAEALGRAVSDMAARAPDAPFLDLALRLPGDVPAGAANRVARRLLDMGFPPEAQALIARDTAGGPMMERRYLRAEAALALGDAATVEAALVGLNDARARDLRARAAAIEPPPEPPAAVAAVPEPAGPPTLADRRALLDGAAAARDRATAILAGAPG